MTLEVLFARESQGQAFLLLMAAGLALGLTGHGSALLQSRCRAVSLLLDALFAAEMGAALLGVMLLTGTGLRLYALLGLVIGLALYAAGLGTLVQRAATRAKRAG